MTTTLPPRNGHPTRTGVAPVPQAVPGPATVAAGETTGGRVARYAWVAARFGLALTFLWACVDKVFGLGFATPAGKGWIDGGNPTKGFLTGAEGPFAGFYHNLAGTTFANVMFVVGLAGIGTALLLGIGMRIAAGAGALLLTMMYTVVLPPETNPVIDDHLILAVLLIGVAAAGAGATFGLGRWWANTPLVKRLPWLK
jgi:thiosulfate dehydrogenase [quinone] large subunit